MERDVDGQMQYKSRKEVMETDGVTVFTYNLNLRAIKMFEMGSIFLLIIAALIEPMTHFEPRQWMIAPIVLAIAAVAAFITAQRWRHFVKTEFLAWDGENLYVTQGSKGAAVVPWNALTLDNSGLKDPTSGSVLNIHLAPEEPIVQLRLVAGFIIVSDFQNVLATILTHIKQNMVPSASQSAESESKQEAVSSEASKAEVSEASKEESSESVSAESTQDSQIG